MKAVYIFGSFLTADYIEVAVYMHEIAIWPVTKQNRKQFVRSGCGILHVNTPCTISKGATLEPNEGILLVQQ